MKASKIITTKSIFTMRAFTGRPLIDMMLEIPTTQSMLKIFDPTTFSMAMSLSPFNVAAIEVATSGNEVPAAIMVRPMMVSFHPRSRLALLKLL